MAGAATAKLAFHQGQHFVDEEVFPAAHGGRVDVLVAAQPGEAVGKGDHGRGHLARRHQTVQPLGQVLAEVFPVHMARAAGGEADQVDQQRQAAAIVPVGDVDDDLAPRRIAQKVGFQHRGLQRQAMQFTGRRRMIPAHGASLVTGISRIKSPACRKR